MQPRAWRPTLRSSLAPILALLSSQLVMGGGITRLEFLGEVRLESGIKVDQQVVGGLSGITYDPQRDRFFVVSDDMGLHGPPRFFTMRIDLSRGLLEESDIVVEAVTPLLDAEGSELPMGVADPEGIALMDGNQLYVSSEGQVSQGVAPFVRLYDLGGSLIREVKLPDRYIPQPEKQTGPRHNMVFEALTLTPDRRYLFTATENALVQDGPQADLERPSPSRLLKIDANSGELLAEYVYWTEPVAAPTMIADGLELTGLVELLSLDHDTVLSLERSFSMGAGNTVRLFEISLQDATDVREYASLGDVDLDGIHPVRKELLLDFRDLGIVLENLEGMTFGPPLADGRKSLLLVGDDNFNPPVQVNQLLAFAVGTESVDVAMIQGASHRSPLEGEWIRGVTGVVTATEIGNQRGLWLQDPGGSTTAGASAGLRLDVKNSESAWIPGDAIRVAGRVTEEGRPGELTVTGIRIRSLQLISRDNPLPPAVPVGPSGRRVPSEVVDDDEMRHFDPDFDGIDFWESLEGMRVRLVKPVIVGATNRFGEIAVTPAVNGARPGRTVAGGLRLRPGDANPERVTLDFQWLTEEPVAAVGDYFSESVAGILDYRYGRYRLRCLAPLPPIESADRLSERTQLTSGSERLTIATFNVANLSATSDEDRLQALAVTLSEALGGADIVALQEIQDDSGPSDDGIVSAHRALTRLVKAVEVAGGPTYEYRQIDPENNLDGGQPGANIRVAFLFNPRRVVFVDRGHAGPRDAVEPQVADGSVRLSLSPGRIDPTAAAFSGDKERKFQSSRKSLAGEFRFGDERILVINNHWTSKRPDTGEFGPLQPPRRTSEDQRSQQARLIADFVNKVLALDPQAGVIVLGDFNDHEFRSPLRVLASARLENLVQRLPPEDRYTYNYQGNSQALDHILVSEGLLSRASARVDIVHLNADLPASRRASDHDPVVIELRLVGSPDGNAR